MATLPTGVDPDVVPCLCGHLPDEHGTGFFCLCGVCDCEDYAPDVDQAIVMLLAQSREYSSTRFPIATATALIGEDPPAWPGRCLEIATYLFDGAATAGTPIEGRVVYGHYRGYMAKDGYFGSRAGLGWTHHGWIDIGRGRVIDPTRWVFENVDPYVYEGPGDDDYDEAGNVFRRELARPCPTATNPDKALTLPPAAADHLAALSGGAMAHTGGTVPADFAQLMWLANLDPAVLGEHARHVYEAMLAAGAAALLPIDNRIKVLAA